MGLVVKLFGREVVSIETDPPPPSTPSATPPRMEAGATHDFERDFAPPDPGDPYRESYGFGFGLDNA